MSRRHLRALLLTAAAALVLCGCAGTQATSASTPASAAASEVASGPGNPSATVSGPAGQRIEVSVTGGEVSGDTGRVSIGSGDRVTLVVSSDTADEVHVHGYDLDGEVRPGTPAELTFDATVPGVFEVELHEAGTVLLTLQVS